MTLVQAMWRSLLVPPVAMLLTSPLPVSNIKNMNFFFLSLLVAVVCQTGYGEGKCLSATTVRVKGVTLFSSNIYFERTRSVATGQRISLRTYSPRDKYERKHFLLVMTTFIF